MAGDWIKMRVWLARDPRTIRMADYLAEQRPFMNWLTDPVQQTCRESAYEHVTRNVIVSLCVTGLLVTWGTAREQGDRIDDDLVLNHCDKYTFDAITDIECFGEAMEHVGWLLDMGDGSVTFPKFFKDNESPDEKHKRQNAERQARFREKQSREANIEVTEVHNVTVTPREEKRRDKNNTADKPAGFCFKTALTDAGGMPDLVTDWMKVRAKLKATNTKSAFNLFMREVEKAGYTVNQALEVCCSRSWKGFDADWVKGSKPIEQEAPKLDTSIEARRSAMQAQADESFRERQWLDGERRYRTIVTIENGQIKRTKHYLESEAAA